MDFDSLVLVRLVRPADATRLSPVDEARQRWAEDPAALAGVFVAVAEPWSVPAAMIVPGGGLPPRSAAEVHG
jgi:hypothetical protein